MSSCSDILYFATPDRLKTCRSPRVVDHDDVLYFHFVFVGRLIMVLSTPNSSARCRVLSMTHRNAVMLELWEGSSWCRLSQALLLAVDFFFAVFLVIVKLIEC